MEQPAARQISTDKLILGTAIDGARTRTPCSRIGISPTLAAVPRSGTPKAPDPSQPALAASTR
ncbi:hypothetical protein [Nocardia brasiliensis]|uniref:hypothetical protein n=1 Tax=Nocardia brasiliensis TaxID=37326 RepID=UPI0033DD3E9A